MTQQISFEISAKPFEDLMNVLNSINQQVTEIGNTLRSTFDPTQFEGFGEGLNIVLGILASVVGIIGTTKQSETLLLGLKTAFSGIGEAASGMGASIANACAISVPQIAAIVAVIAAVIAIIIVCWDEVKIICAQIWNWIDSSFLTPSFRRDRRNCILGLGRVHPTVVGKLKKLCQVIKRNGYGNMEQFSRSIGSMAC